MRKIHAQQDLICGYSLPQEGNKLSIYMTLILYKVRYL